MHHDTLELRWPTAERGTAPVTSPLVAVRPERLAATLPCPAIADQGTALTTAPPDAPGADDVGLVVASAGGSVTVTSGGTELADAPLPAGPDCALSITSTATRTTVQLGGEVLLDEGADRRPAVVGVCSALVDPAGVDVAITVDNRYDSTAGALKIAAGVGAVLALLGAMVALHGVDHRRGRQLPGCTPARRGCPAARRRGDRHARGVAAERRRHRRRRLHPHDGAHRGRHRLRRQLLPLVRRARGAVRLVLRAVRALGGRERLGGVAAAAVPAYRALADEQLRVLGIPGRPPRRVARWRGLELVDEPVEVPARLAGEPGRDWGELRRIDLHEPTAGSPDATRGTARHWGWETPGPQGDPPPGRPGVGR